MLAVESFQKRRWEFVVSAATMVQPQLRPHSRVCGALQT